MALKDQFPVAVKAGALPVETRPMEALGKELIRIILDFGDYSEVCIEAGNGMMKKERALHVYTKTKIYHYDDTQSQVLCIEKRSGTGGRSLIEVDNIRPLHSSLSAFEKKIRDNNTSTSSLEMGLNVVKTLEAIQASIDTLDWVNIDGCDRR